MFLRALLIVTLNIHVIACAQNTDSLIFRIEPAPSNIEVSTLKSYLGCFEFEYANERTTQLNDYKLVDWINAPFITFENVDLQNLTSLSFLIGVDSNQLLNGAMEGDLDPGNGMFWTWQSGYINLKLEYLEGGSQLDFHIGGYRENQNTTYRLTIEIPQKKQLEGFAFQTETFIEFVKTNNMASVMSPGEKAVEIAQHYNQFITPIWNEESR